MENQEKYKFIYTIIHHGPRIKHNISNNDYCIASAIYHLSTNPDAKFKGWYYGKIETLATMFQLSRATAYNSVNKLIERGIIERDEESGYLKTSHMWWKDFVNNKIYEESKS